MATKETELPWLRIRDSRSENARKTVAVLRLGWTPSEGSPARSRSKSTSTARASSFRIPKGVTAPFSNPRKRFSRSSEAKDRALVPSCPRSALRSTVLQLHRTTRKWRLPRASRRKRFLAISASASRCRRSISSMVYTGSCETMR